MTLQWRVLALVLGLCTAGCASVESLFPSNNPYDILRLVNRDHKLPYEFVPDVVLPNVPAAPGKEEYVYLREEAARALEALFSAALAEGHTLYAVSGYRSYSLQASLFRRKVERVGSEAKAMLTVAPPGASEHQLGLAMEINGETMLSLGLTEDFGASPEGLWVYENAHRFGFIIRYPEGKTDITGYAWEPWHLRYVGEDAAREMHSLQVTFEEYHALLQERRVQAWSQETKEEL